MIIKPATEDDLPALLSLYHHLIPDDPALAPDKARAIFEQFHRQNMGEIYIGWDNGKAVASCCLVVVPNLTRGGRPYALIENVVTHSEHRGKGHGKAILRFACDQAFAKDCYKVMLLTGSSKPDILKFYLSAGFEQNKTGFQMRDIPTLLD
jgi:GNAT superfamily N-acetyltransferase